MKRILLALAGIAALSALAWADPPARVGRLSFVDGTVAFAPAAGEKFETATVNYPLTAGNQLSTAESSRAEIQIGSAAVQLGPSTEISFETLDDQTVQIRLDKGRMSVRLRELGQDQGFQVDMVTASISLAPGSYRFEQAEAGDASVTTREGDAQVTGGQAAFHVPAGQRADIPASGPDAYRLSSAPAPDDWDQWVAERDSRDAQAPSRRYVSSEMDGVGDLDAYGNWRVIAGYGPVWFPATVAVGWAPYTFGQWVWINPWGWTWVDEEPWGFAPFHYGRWASITGTWCWVPGPIVRRPVYAPALVRWVGGVPWRGHPPGSQVGIRWAPLAPHQVFRPLYHASGTYVRAVNGAIVLPPRMAVRPGGTFRPGYGTRGQMPQGRPEITGRAPWAPGRPQVMAHGPWAQDRPSYAPRYAPRGAAPQNGEPRYVRQAPRRSRDQGSDNQDPELWKRGGH